MFEKIKSAFGRFVAVFMLIITNYRAEMTDKIVGLVIGLTVAGAMLPSAIVSLSNSTLYSGADAGVITLATVVLPTIAVIAVVLIVLKARKG